MKRWLALALLGLAVIWGPYVYSELASEPVKASGKQRSALRFFGGDDEAEEEAEEDPSAEPEAVEEPEKPDEAKPATEQAKADEAKKDDKPAQQDPAQAEEAEPEGDKAAEGKAEDPSVADLERPTLPSDLLPGFRKVFDAEPRDAFWANDEEGKLRALFVAAGATADTLAEVACRTTVCRVTFTPDELEIEALGKLYDGLRARHPDGLALDHKAEPVGQRGTLYMLRAGYKLEH